MPDEASNKDELLEFSLLAFGLCNNSQGNFDRTTRPALTGMGYISATHLDDALVFAPILHGLLRRMEIISVSLLQAGLSSNLANASYAPNKLDT